MLMIIIINHLENNHDNGFDNHLFLKDLNLNLRRREVAIEVKTTLSDGDTFCAPAHHHNQNEDEVGGQDEDRNEAVWKRILGLFTVLPKIFKLTLEGV